MIDFVQCILFFFNDPATTEIYTLSLHDALPILLIDFSSLDAFCGFGEIARQYLRCLAKSDVDDMRFVLMVPEKHKGEYGDRFLYISAEHAAKIGRAHV